MGKIVYHGTFSDYPPHEYEQDTFHAGTLAATDQRLEDEMSHGFNIPEVPVWKVHAYEISGSAPTHRRMWSDPDIGLSIHNYEGAPPAVPEGDESKIHKYKNVREDRGSTSFVIPSRFVHEGQHVKHLGVQFQGIMDTDDKAQPIYKAMSTMVGGK